VLRRKRPWYMQPVQRFSLPVTAAGTDIDDLGHVSNLVYLRWVQEVAEAHSAAVGWSAEAYRRLGAVFVVRRHELDYLVPAYAGDDLELVTWVADWRGASSTRKTEVVRRDGVVLARAATLWAFIDLERLRPRRIPDELKAAF
jgi:acyl-CoA thioester hydrolase